MFPSLIQSSEVNRNKPEAEASAETNSLTRFSGELGELAMSCLNLESQDRREWIKKRVERMNELMQSFSSAQISQGMYDVIYLYETTSALDLKNPDLPEEISNKRRELVEDYLTQAKLTSKESDYVFSILNDLSYMDEEANSYRSHPNIYEDKLDKRFKSVIKDDYNKEINVADWLVRGKDINFGRMKEVLTQVNLESVIIKAIQLMDDLGKSQDHSEVELLHKINEAEYFYSPICEIIGFDGLATALRDKSLQIRFMKSGNNEALNKAKELHSKVGMPDVERVLGTLDNRSPNEYIIDHVAGKLEGKDDIVNVGDFMIDFPKIIGSVFGSYRIKTVGSIADKIVRKPEYAEALPMDLIGLVFVLEDESNLELAISHVFHKLEGKVEFRSTPNKTSPFYIQANKQRLKRLERLLSDFDENIQTKVVNRGQFQVAKMTFVMNDNPDASVELQFLTRADRKAARVGQDAHIMYKLNKDVSGIDASNQEEFMKDINRRRSHMVCLNGDLTTQPESLKRAQRQYNLI